MMLKGLLDCCRSMNVRGPLAVADELIDRLLESELGRTASLYCTVLGRCSASTTDNSHKESRSLSKLNTVKRDLIQLYLLLLVVSSQSGAEEWLVTHYPNQNLIHLNIDHHAPFQELLFDVDNARSNCRLSTQSYW